MYTNKLLAQSQLELAQALVVDALTTASRGHRKSAMSAAKAALEAVDRAERRNVLPTQELDIHRAMVKATIHFLQERPTVICEGCGVAYDPYAESSGNSRCAECYN